MSAPSQFPAFLSIEYDGRGDGFPAFERAANASIGQVEGRLRQFTRSFEEVGRVASKAIAGGVSNAGGLDLGVGQFKMAAAEARLYEETLREMHTAASRLAVEVGDTSRATTSYVQALSAQTIEAQRAREEAEAQVVTYARLQQAMDGASSAESRMSAAFRDVQKMREAAQFAKEYEQALFNIRQQVDPAYFAQKRFNQELAFADQALRAGDITADQYAKRLAFLRGEMALNAASTRQMRFASVQLGQQLQDVVIQAQMGTNAFVILAQQGSQMAFALTEAEGKVGAVARALAGWQGAIVFAGVALVGQLIPALMNSSQKALQLEDALSKVKFASDAVQSAQGILGNVMDITTGKISTQRQELLDLAKAQLLVAQLQARARADAARGQVGDLAKPTMEYGGGMGGGLYVGRRPAGLRGQFANEFLAGKSSAEETINRLKLLADNGRMTKEAFAEAAAAVANFNLETANIKSLEAAERLLSGKGTAADRKLLLKPDKPKDTSKELATLAERGEDVAKKIANITDRFSDMPPQVRSVNAALRELDDLADDFSKKKPPNYGEIVTMIAEARKAIQENGLDQPVNDLLEAQQQQLVINDLQARGREAEAAALQQILQKEKDRGPLTQAQKDAILESNVALRAQTRELERQQFYQRNLLNFVQAQREAVNDLVYNLLSGKGLSSVGGFVKGVFNNYLRALSDEITNSLTANFFQKQTDRIKGETHLSDAGKRMASSIDELKKALDSLTKSVSTAAGEISDAPTTPTAANDNGSNTITATARRTVSQTLKDGLKDIGKAIFGEKGAAKFGQVAGAAMQGAAVGTMTSGVLKSLGVKQSTLGAQLGGALGSAVAGPLGAVVGSVLGGTVGGMLKKTKWGAVTVNSGGVSQGSGNSGSAIGAAVQAGGAFDSQLRKIADALGGKIGDFGNITIGQRHGDWRVNTGGTSLKVKKGATDFNGDGEAAIAYAVQIALERGAVTGLRNGTNNLLKAAGDMQEKLSKALSFEGVFRDLAKFKDPVGSAINDLNLEYNKLKDIFTQAGATTAEWGQLEELYQIKRKSATEEALRSLTGSLDDLYKNLTIGDNGYSVRTRLSNARANYDPLAARVAAGDSTAYNDFAAAAQTLIELQREYSGSAPEYFAVLDQVTALTKGELDRQKALYSSAAGSASPFDTQPIVDATQQQTNAIVTALGAQNQAANDNAARILAALQALGARGSLGRLNF
ncbi:phage tail length tape measure family protein [Sphingobium sp. DEHP117]|uniref:phage tail length tape measure family protein n=1 Tax=Sphingobium sp. DEHP117 TaxID=2993436 RepID=UPI0027D4B47A|nr:phage tail length tape measure family protein [Sphingobium sp. DEHP117]MDQ4421474.1 phage tail length tape measure family protein [Sphingobium sp. DEHP117]